jgi:hypothetical protein
MIGILFLFNFNYKFSIPSGFEFFWRDVEVQREKTIESLFIRSVVRLGDCWHKQGESWKNLYIHDILLTYTRSCSLPRDVMLPHIVPETPTEKKIIVEEFLVFVAGIPYWVDIFCVLQGWPYYLDGGSYYQLR